MTIARMPLVCAYEDRTSAMPGVALLARSLAFHAPDLRLRIVSPLDQMAALAEELPNLDWVKDNALNGRGWNVKPTVLLAGLEVAEEVLWLDTDVVISGDLAGLLEAMPRGMLAVGQEFRLPSPGGGAIRAKGWDLTVGRSLAYHVNSGSVRANRGHRELLHRWSELLADPSYVAAQRTSVGERPVHMVGDQDVLWALLTSTEFAGVPVYYIRPGSDMIQHCGANGYHVMERLANIVGSRATFVHMLGRYKPWSFEVVPDWRRQRTDYLNMVAFELSPYHAASARFAEALGAPAWLTRRTRLARLLNTLALGNIALRGFPLALAAWVAEVTKRR